MKNFATFAILLFTFSICQRITRVATFELAAANEIISMPPGCKCLSIEQRDEGSQCEQFDCECTCDLTAAMCDLDCCCDPDCSAQDFLSFQCTAVTENRNSLPICGADMHDRWMVEDAATSPTQIGGFVQDAMDNLLCVQLDNSAVKGSFFKRIDQIPTESALNDLKGADFSRILNTVSIQNESRNYIVGDHLQAVQKEGPGQLRSVDVLLLPSSTDGGFCSEFNAVEFGANSDVSCTQIIESLENDCTRLLSIDQYSEVLSGEILYTTRFDK